MIEIDPIHTIEKDISKTIGIFFVCITLLLLVIFRDGSEDKKIEGDLIVQMFWDNNSRIDVDLWVQTPGDSPVFFSRKNGLVSNLLRDDLGSAGDVVPLNYEINTTYNPPKGKYSINAEIFNFNGDPKNDVDVVITVMYNKNGVKFLNKTIKKKLTDLRKHKTFLNFELDSVGKVLHWSVDDKYTRMKEE